jgi:hypothetical protein
MTRVVSSTVSGRPHFINKTAAGSPTEISELPQRIEPSAQAEVDIANRVATIIVKIDFLMTHLNLKFIPQPLYTS